MTEMLWGEGLRPELRQASDTLMQRPLLRSNIRFPLGLSVLGHFSEPFPTLKYKNFFLYMIFFLIAPNTESIGVWQCNLVGHSWSMVILGMQAHVQVAYTACSATALVFLSLGTLHDTKKLFVSCRLLSNNNVNVVQCLKQSSVFWRECYGKIIV